MAIEHGLTVLSWFENNVKDDVPPEHLWEDTEGLEEWWDRVKERTEARMSGRQSAPGADPADEELSDNELARMLRE